MVSDFDSARQFVDQDDINICCVQRQISEEFSDAWLELPSEVTVVVDYLQGATVQKSMEPLIPSAIALRPILDKASPGMQEAVMAELLQLGTFFQQLLHCKAVETRLEIMDAKVWTVYQAQCVLCIRMSSSSC